MLKFLYSTQNTSIDSVERALCERKDGSETISFALCVYSLDFRVVKTI